MSKKTILIVYEYFYPGFKAGGPIQSLVNMIQLLCNDFNFKVLTTAYDLTESKPYENVETNNWNSVQLPETDTVISVWYSSKRKPSFIEFYRVIKSAKPEIIFINGLFTRHFVYPLLLKQSKVINSKIRLIISPRGMTQPGAIAIRSKEKSIFFGLIKKTNLLSNTTFHASSKEEIKDIKALFSPSSEVVFASNIPKTPVYLNHTKKTSGLLKLIYLSIITPKKNLLLLLEVLNQCKEKIELDIYGPVKEQWYWVKCQALIKQLPVNITVSYKKEIQSREVQATFSKYDALILPTSGENFGHALYECMGVGTPIITSNYTPWNNLELYNAGWNVDIDNTHNKISIIAELLDRLSLYDNHIWEKEKHGAFSFALNYFNSQSFREDYLRLFAYAE